MIPADIGPHPAAPDHYIVMGKPANWDENDCGKLAVRTVGATADVFYEPAARVARSQLPSGEEIYPAFLSEWTPTKEELALLNAGEPVRLLISGRNLPPCSLWVRTGDEV